MTLNIMPGTTSKEEKEFAVRSQNQSRYAKEVLLMCNVSRSKDPRSMRHTSLNTGFGASHPGSSSGFKTTLPNEYMRKGEGRTAMNVDYTNMEVYEILKKESPKRLKVI